MGVACTRPRGRVSSPRRARGWSQEDEAAEDGAGGGSEPLKRALEAELQRALRSGDPRLIERACSEAEAQGYDQAKVSLGRAEAKWLWAQAELNEALRSGDSSRIEKAYREADRAGVDAAQVAGAGGRSPSSPATSPRGPAERSPRARLDDSWTAKATMCAAVSVLLYEWSAYNFVFLKTVLPARGKHNLVLPFAVAFNLVWGLAACCFLRCHLTDPGFVPHRWYEFARAAGDALPVAPARLEWQPGKATHCKKCDLPRPERAHHCHVCNVCVLRMDHHCPWIKNCVGFGNHKFFLLLVLYCLLSSMVALGTACPDLIHVAVALLQLGGDEGDWKTSRIQLADAVVFLIFGALALLFGGLLTPMLLTHVELACSNTTTIEGHYENSNMPNPFDQGTARGNLAQVFGAFGPDWALPVHPVHPLSDGVCFLPATVAADAAEAPFGDESSWRLRYQVQTKTPRGTPTRPAPSGMSWWWYSTGTGHDAAQNGDGPRSHWRNQTLGSGFLRQVVSI